MTRKEKRTDLQGNSGQKSTGSCWEGEMTSIWTTSVMAVAMCAGAGHALAAVSAQEAAKLKTTLTPVGAEKAGNADGSIPAWTGGMTGATADYVKGGRRVDPFADEKPLYSVTSKNLSQYADKLSDGVKGLFAKYPDTYRVDVYQTHRAFAAPQNFYDNTFINATSGALAGGDGAKIPQNVFGGIPFPIPQNGDEIIWNHLLNWKGVRNQALVDGTLITADGKRVVTANSFLNFWYPIADPEIKRENFDGMFLMLYTVNNGPPIRAGEAVVLNTHLDHAKDRAWIYLTGQRRVRMLPNACCDTPSPASAGVSSFDEYWVFSNTPTRFDWKLIGKKEMIIPYNSNMSLVPKATDEILSDHHMNPDKIRWEKHRVWVIEANLREGQRHLYPRSVYYVDEDSWTAVLGDRYDSNNSLAHTMWTLLVAAPDVPGELITTNGFYDLTSGAWYVANSPNNYNMQFLADVKSERADFTPESLAAAGVR